MTLQELKDRRKGYTSAFGYCSCREDDLDWLISQVDTLSDKADKMALALESHWKKCTRDIDTCRLCEAHLETRGF